jgi:Kef-type K+ transport system membrane component KefB
VSVDFAVERVEPVARTRDAQLVGAERRPKWRISLADEGIEMAPVRTESGALSKVTHWKRLAPEPVWRNMRWPYAMRSKIEQMAKSAGRSYLTKPRSSMTVRPDQRMTPCYTDRRFMGFFLELSLILALATGVAIIMQKLRLPLLLGHILTGILAGPAVMQIIQGKETIEVFSQLGITALLFVVGLSLNPAVIREVGRVAVTTGIGQIVFTTAFGCLLALLLGYPFTTAIFIAVALTFSSTIIIMKLLSERGDEGRLYGKISIGFLLVQDLVATLILILISTFSKGGDFAAALLTTSGKMLGIVFVLSLFAKFVLPNLSRQFAKSQEFLFLFSAGWGIGLAALFHALGLSIEIGALAAGVSLASSPYRFEITAKMRLLRDFFIVMFFVLLGAQLSWDSILAQLPHALVFSLFILIGNPLIVISIMGWMNYSKKTSFYAGLTVAQISEFSLILILLVAQKGLIPESVIPLVTIVGIVTIAASTVMILKADALYAWFAPYLGMFERAHPRKERQSKERYDALVFGCHRVGTEFLSILKKNRLKYLVIDFDPSMIENLKRQGVPCRYGDAHDNEFLEELNLAAAKIIISTIPETEVNMLLLQKAKKANMQTMVIVSAHTPEQAQALYGAKADYVIMPHFLGGNYTAMMLDRYGLKKIPFMRERKRHIRHLESRTA